MSFVLYYGLFIASTLIFLWSRRKYYILSWKLPGPLGYPLLGSGLGFLNREKILDFMLGLRKKYGPVYFGYLGLTPVLVVSDPAMAEKLLTSQSFVNKSFIYNGVKCAVGDALFSSNYARWSYHRRLLNPSFNHKILLSFYPIFNKEAKKLINNLGQHVGKGPINMHLMLQKCTMDTACQTTMGKEINLQSDKNLDILRSYYELMIYTTERIFVPWYVSDFLYQFSSSSKHFDRVVKSTGDFVYKLIEEKLKKGANLSQENRDDDTSSYSDDEVKIVKSKNIFLDQAIKLMATNNFTATDVQVESNGMIAAAFETTANVMYTTLMSLAMFPEYQERVFDEILALFPEKDFEVGFEDTQNLVYLEMVINETMRLLAPVPLIARACSEDFDIGKGVIIPKGTQIAVNIFHMQRDEKIWGPQARTFNPDHFLKDNFNRMHPYAFIPFTKGMRNCIGWRYGMMSLKVFLAQILRKYYFTTQFKFEDLVYIEDITLKFKVTPLLEVHERKQ